MVSICVSVIVFVSNNNNSKVMPIMLTGIGNDIFSEIILDKKTNKKVKLICNIKLIANSYRC